jgi:hypothetical protein
MRYNYAPLLLALCLAASCSGTLPAGLQSDASPLRQASWDPLAPRVELAPLNQALDSARWLECDGFAVTALTARNQTDTAVLRQLRLRTGGSQLQLALAGPVPAAALYVRYDAARLSYSGAQWERQTAVQLALDVEPGLIAAGAVGLRGQPLPAGALLRLSFAAGPAHPARATASITQDSRSKVANLTATGESPDSATLQWSERHTGDYDLNGEVNIADLTPIGFYFQSAFNTSHADYAKLEVVDGDNNGEINIADITPIGANFRSSISGYDIFRTQLNTPDEIPDPAETARWTKVENTANPSGPSAPRDFNGQDFRLVYTFLDQCGTGDFGWYVRPVNYIDSPASSGPISNVATVVLTPPNAKLSFEIQPPGGPLANVGGEFYLGIKVENITGLFSANVRFEYDASMVEFQEGVASYTDHLNFLEPPLFVAAGNVGSATAPYQLAGFNATQTAGTAVKDGSGIIGYIKFKCIGEGVNDQCFRFPQSTSFIYLWGESYGVPVATPELGAPQIMNIGP